MTRKISSSYGRNFAIVDGEIFDEQFLFRKLDRHQIFLRDAGHHPRATSYPYFWISSEHKQVKLQCCNEFRNEGVVSVPRDNPHSSQKKIFYFSSFIILAAQRQFVISASFLYASLQSGRIFANISLTPFARQSVSFIANVCIVNVLLFTIFGRVRAIPMLA